MAKSSIISVIARVELPPASASTFAVNASPHCGPHSASHTTYNTPKTLLTATANFVHDERLCSDQANLAESSPTRLCRRSASSACDIGRIDAGSNDR